MQYFESEYSVCFLHKCCGCCKHFIQSNTIIPDYRTPGMPDNEVIAGICSITERSITNRTTPCKQWQCEDGVTVWY